MILLWPLKAARTYKQKGKSLSLWCESKTNFCPMSIETLTDIIFSKMSEVGKWQRDFLRHLFRLALSFRGKFNFLSMERQGSYNELTYRQNFKRSFNWLAFNFELIMAYTLPERILVFDPSYAMC